MYINFEHVMTKKKVERFKYLIKRFLFSLKNDNYKQFISKIKKFIFLDNKIDLDKFKIDPNLSLDDICLTFGTDKGYLDSKKKYQYLLKSGDKTFKNYYEWISRKDLYKYECPLGANYTPYYKQHFESRRFEKLKILEIGVANGHSTASFYYYFPNSELVGIDLKDKYKLFYKSKRIKYKKVDITNKSQVNSYIRENNNFDIVIDDSLHNYYGYTNNIKNFFPSVKPGGVYILEDFNPFDDYIEKIRKWNMDHNRKTWEYAQNTMEDVFKYIKEKKLFIDDYLDHKTQKYLMENIKDIYSERSHHPSGSIAFIFKK